MPASYRSRLEKFVRLDSLEMNLGGFSVGNIPRTADA